MDNEPSRVDEVTEFLFKDLSASAQDTVIENNRYHDVEFNDWYGYMYEVHKEKLRALGFTNIDMQFSGFGSQGDGAVILGRVSYFNFLKQSDEGNAMLVALKLRFPDEDDREDYDGTITFTHRGHYCHEHSYIKELECNCYGVPDTFDEETNTRIRDFVEENVDDWVVGLSKALYHDLGAEYDYLTSDDYLRELFTGNDQTLYTAEGESV